MKHLHLLFWLCALFAKTHIFGQEANLQKHEQKISQTIYLTHGIMTHSPEIIKSRRGAKIYIQEQFVTREHDNELGAMLHVDCEHQVYIPLLLSDELGYYTSVLREFWAKMFHQKCNECGYEWEASWCEFTCPQCGSSDFSNVPN